MAATLQHLIDWQKRLALSRVPVAEWDGLPAATRHDILGRFGLYQEDLTPDTKRALASKAGRG